jgi:hypothetical protein
MLAAVLHFCGMQAKPFQPEHASEDSALQLHIVDADGGFISALWNLLQKWGAEYIRIDGALWMRPAIYQVYLRYIWSCILCELKCR